MADYHSNDKKLEMYMRFIEEIPNENKDLIKRFLDECFAHGLTISRVLFYASKLFVISRLIKHKDFGKLTETEIKSIVKQIEQGDYSYKTFNGKIKKGKYSEWSKAGYKLTLKRFFQWLRGFEWSSQKYPKEVEWIRTSARKKKLPEVVVLTREEVLKIFNVAEGMREKALASFMYESGCRVPDELFSIKLSDIEFKNNHALVKIHSGKTGTYRIIPIVSSVMHLKNYIQEAHANLGHETCLFVRKGSDKLMSYAMLRKIVKKWIKKAVINKKITPYSFRRSRYTHLSTIIPTPVLYRFMGQVQGSRAIERYVALNNEDMQNVILGFNGLPSETKNSNINIIFCPRCNNMNSPEKEYCDFCSSPLTEKARLENIEKQKVDLAALVEELIKKRMEELKK